MKRQPARSGTERKTERYALLGRSLKLHPSSAFLLAGGLFFGSVLAPVALESLSAWYWAAGLVLVASGVLSAAVGLVGLSQRVGDEAPRLALTGLLSAAAAGIAALGLILLVNVAFVAEMTNVRLGTPITVFAVLALSMAAGLSLGFLSIGVALRRTPRFSGISGALTVLGGGILLVPVASEALRLGYGIGPPQWTLFPILGLFYLDTLLVWYSLRSESTRHE